MEQIYSSTDVTIYDDFAHHPTAIATTLHGLRAKVGGEKILAIIEPGSHTMRNGTHASSLKQSARLADNVLWFRPEHLSWDMQTSIGDHRNQIFNSTDEILDTALREIEQNGGKQHIVIMSNSGFDSIPRKLVEKLGA
jgi:UDP-N-acetylmuramate: L-alanyl-gamma-D-glutamyl-meso-diaminopimelate ligase